MLSLDSFDGFLLQEFDMEIRDKKKGVENVVAYHLSRLERENESGQPKEIEEFFPVEQLMMVGVPLPWYANIVNFLACKVLPPKLSFQQKKKFLHVKYYQWDDPFIPEMCISNCEKVRTGDRI